MKKGLLLLLFLFLFCGVTQAQVEVFYLPDSGFLRVTGEVLMEPTSTSLSFLVFPNAQITEFWADGLVDYSIHRGAQGTIVTFALREAIPQSLSFSYEGFLESQGGQITLGREQLWFPEFSFLSQNPEVKVQLPLTWEFSAEGLVETSVQGSFQVIAWQTEQNRYPTFQATNPTMPLIEIVEEVVESLPEPNIPKVSEDISRIQMQITRLTSAMSRRSVVDLEQLLSPQLQEEELAHYLADLPAYYGSVASQVISTPEHASGEFEVIFSTERGSRYLASMTWQDESGSMQLATFRMTPFQAEVPHEVVASVEGFLLELQNAIKTGDDTRLEALVEPGVVQDTQQVLAFLSSLDANVPWTMEHLNLDPFTVLVFVPHSQNTRLLLNLKLIPGQYHWLIHSIQVLPLS